MDESLFESHTSNTDLYRDQTGNRSNIVPEPDYM